MGNHRHDDNIVKGNVVMEYRIERDTMGEIQVPADKLWGAQTQRSLQNFKISGEKMPLEVVYGMAIVKKASALANQRGKQAAARKRI